MKKKFSRPFVQRLLAWLALTLCFGFFLYTYRRPISLRLSNINPFSCSRNYSSAEVRRLRIDLKRSYPCVQDVIFEYYPVGYKVYCYLTEVPLEEVQQVAGALTAQLSSEETLMPLIEDFTKQYSSHSLPTQILIDLCAGPNDTYRYFATARYYEPNWNEYKPGAEQHIDLFQTWHGEWYDREGRITP